MRSLEMKEFSEVYFVKSFSLRCSAKSWTMAVFRKTYTLCGRQNSSKLETIRSLGLTASISKKIFQFEMQCEELDHGGIQEDLR